MVCSLVLKFCPSLRLWRLIILPSSRHYSRHYSRHHLVHHLLCVGCVPPKPSPQHDVAPLALCNVALARSGMSSQAAAQAKRRRGEDRSRNSIMAGLQASVRNLHGIVGRVLAPTIPSGGFYMRDADEPRMFEYLWSGDYSDSLTRRERRGVRASATSM